MKIKRCFALLLALILVVPQGAVASAATVSYRYYGDLDGNNRVTVTDLSALNQAVNGQIVLTAEEKKCADLNGDGRIDSSDVDLMRQYILGSITSFPVGTYYIVVRSYSLSVDKTEIQMDGAGGSSSFYVNVGSGGGFRVSSSDSSWLKVGKNSYYTGSSASFTGSGTVYITAEENSGTYPRTGMIRIVHDKDSTVTRSIRVTQEKGVLKASLVTDRAQMEFTGESGSVPIYVDTNRSGGFRATSSNSSWLKVGRYSYSTGSNVSMSDSGTLYVAVEANSKSYSRSGTITLVHDKDSTVTKTIRVTQQASPVQEVMSLVTDKTQISFTGDSGSDNFHVDTKDSGGFRASSSNSWLKVGRYSYYTDSSASFTGSSTVYVTVDKNDGRSPRNGTITLTHSKDSSLISTVRVTQEAGDAEVSLDLDKTQMSFTGDGGLDYFNVNTNGSGGFMVSSSSPWLEVGKYSYDTGSSVSYTRGGKVYATVTENNGPSRSGTITLTHSADSSLTKTIRVTQAAGVSKASLKPDKTQIRISKDGGGSSFYVDTDNSGGFRASSSDSWLSVGKYIYNLSSSDSFTGSGTVYVSAQENGTSESRTGTITLTHDKDSLVSSTIEVVQEAGEKPVLKPEKEKIETEPDGTSTFFYVDTEGTGAFRASSSSSWIKVGTSYGNSQYATFTDSGNVYVAIEKNSQSASRTGTITLTHAKDSTVSKTVEIVQQGKETYLKADVSEITANARGILSRSYVTVDTHDTGGFKVSSGESWIKVGRTSSQYSAGRSLNFTKGGTFYVFVEESKEVSKRQGKITIIHGDNKLKSEITVIQDKLSARLVVGTDGLVADQSGVISDNWVSVKTQKTGGFTVEVESGDWLAIASKNIMDKNSGLSKLTFDGDSKFYVFAEENTGSKRTATITVRHSAVDLSRKITVTQLGNEDYYLEVDRETAYFDVSDAAVSGIANVHASPGLKWKIETSAGWIKVAKSTSAFDNRKISMNGEGDSPFYIFVDKNSSFKQREGLVTISAPGMESSEIYVSQVENEGEPPIDELSVYVTHKTFNVGKTSKIRFSFPEGLFPSDLKKITYSSNKTRVAVVRKNGTIKAKKKGKATITVKAVAYNGKSKVFKLRITVGKRNVSITNKK